MHTRASAIILFVLLLLSGSSTAAEPSAGGKLTDAEVTDRIIKESINQYSGNCPCPYNAASNGSRCGGRSAYSKKGGFAPLCFASDVSKEMITEWRSRH